MASDSELALAGVARSPDVPAGQALAGGVGCYSTALGVAKWLSMQQLHRLYQLLGSRPHRGLKCPGTGVLGAGRGTEVDKMSKGFNFWEKQRTPKRISFGQ